MLRRAEAHIPQLFAGQEKGRRGPRLGGGLRDRRGSVLDRDAALRTCGAAGESADDPDLRDRHRRAGDRGCARRALSVNDRSGRFAGTVARFFVQDHGRYRVRKEMREKVLFASHNLLRDAPFSRCDLISCRNLLIYLTREGAGAGLRHFPFRAARRRPAFHRRLGKQQHGAIAFFAGGREASALRAPFDAAADLEGAHSLRCARWENSATLPVSQPRTVAAA